MLSTIVAVARNNAIGKNNELPWRLPAELAHFKQLTVGHPIIMGRKTHESIGRALPGRTNIVVTHDQNFKAAKGCRVVGSLDEAILISKKVEGGGEIFIIGGEQIYKQAMPKLDRIYMTKIDAEIDGDKFFKLDKSGWKQTFSEKHPADEENKYPYEFTTLERV